MKSKFQKIIIIILLLMPSIFMACKKEKEIDTSSPAYHIAESEKLTLPATIDFPANASGHTRVATYYAQGVQKYVSQIKYGGSPVIYEWVLNGPQAELYDANNRKVGTHGFGPYWQIFSTDSIFAQASNPPRVISVDSTSIPWLLLVPKNGRIVTGIFANVSYIQRIATKGGKAPATAPTSATETVDVPYTAIYRFTKKN